MYKNFDEILIAAKAKGPKRVAVAAAEDRDVLEAIKDAKEQGIIEGILVGDKDKIQQIGEEIGFNPAEYKIIDQKDKKDAALKAVALVSSGEADLVMKGLLGTADILRAVLDKEVGLRTGKILSHVAVMEIERYHKLLLMTDGGMNILPDLKEKVDIINNAIQVANAIGISYPKVAPITALELVNPDMDATIDAAILSKMADRGQIKGAIIDGPLALDNAISKEAAEHKGIISPVAGDADILLVPNIETGNVLYKSIVYFAKGKVAGIIVGAKAPIILVSRSDSPLAKLYSIALGVIIASNRQ